MIFYIFHLGFVSKFYIDIFRQTLLKNLVLDFQISICYYSIKYVIAYRRVVYLETLKIGQQLKSIRINRNMTLDDMASITGVSKPMLGQIERSLSSPTINTLWKIATGLKIPFSTFLQQQTAEYTVVDLIESNLVLEENGAMRAYTLFAFDPVRGSEAFYIEFDSGCYHHSTKHNEGVEEYIFVTHGKLDMLLNGEKVTLEEKQAIRFKADIPHSYLNPYEDMCSIYNTIFYHL